MNDALKSLASIVALNSSFGGLYDSQLPVDHGRMPRQDEIDHKKVTRGDQQIRRQRKAKKKAAKVKAQLAAEKLARDLRLKRKGKYSD